MIKIASLLLLLFSVPALAANDALPNSAVNFGHTRHEVSPNHTYFGIGVGEGQSAGTQYPMGTGFAYMITGGLELQKSYGIGLTYQHSSLSYDYSGVKSGVNQILLEANVFSLLVLNGGFHIGDVIKSEGNVSTADLGFGIHMGLDVNLSPHFTTGVVGYWTLVYEREDHHSLFNLLVPLKYWY